jgi:hypothetical protein
MRGERPNERIQARNDLMRELQNDEFWTVNPNSAFEQSSSCTFKDKAIEDLKLTRYWDEAKVESGKDIKAGFYISIRSDKKSYADNILTGPFDSSEDAEMFGLKRMLEIKDRRSTD